MLKKRITSLYVVGDGKPFLRNCCLQPFVGHLARWAFTICCSQPLRARPRAFLLSLQTSSSFCEGTSRLNAMRTMLHIAHVHSQGWFIWNWFWFYIGKNSDFSFLEELKIFVTHGGPNWPSWGIKDFSLATGVTTDHSEKVKKNSYPRGSHCTSITLLTCQKVFETTQNTPWRKGRKCSFFVTNKHILHHDM